MPFAGGVRVAINRGRLSLGIVYACWRAGKPDVGIVRSLRSTGGAERQRHVLTSWTTIANDAEHDGRSRRNSIESVGQVVSGADRLSIELDDAIAWLKPCLRCRRAGQHFANDCSFTDCEGYVFRVLLTRGPGNPVAIGESVAPVPSRPFALVSRQLRDCWLSVPFQANTQISAIDAASGSELISDPECISSRDGKSEVGITLRAS